MANAVATKKKQEVAPADLMSMFEEQSGAGLENLTQDDLALPFIKILSGLDPILDEREDARKGDIYNTVTGQVYKGKDGIRVVSCAFQKRFIQWAPRGQGSGAPLNIFSPGEAMPKTERSSEDNKDYVVGGDGDYIEETHQHFVLVVNDDGTAETALIAMKSTQLKKLMDAYCQRQGLSNNQCRFIFDGERIKEDDSPETLEMENGDEIDVMVEQTGGK